MSRTLSILLAACLGGAPLAGCVVYEPVPAQQDSGLSERFSQAFDRRMGR